MKKLLLLSTLTLCFLTSFSQAKKVKFQADIANKNGDLLYIKDQANKTIQELKSKIGNHFESEFSVNEGIFVLFDGVEYTLVYLKNGFDLKLTMDAKRFDESIKYSGIGALENNYLAEKSVMNGTYRDKISLCTDEKESTAVVQDFKKMFENKLAAGKYNAKFKEYARKMIATESNELTMQSEGLIKKRKLNNSEAPSFEYFNNIGEKVSLKNFKGKYVYIDFWATWCGPCRQEIPFLQKLESQFKDKNIVFLSISIDEEKDLEKWKNFVKSKQLGGVQVIADKNWNSEFVKHFGVNSIPRFVLIDPKGMIVNADAMRPSDEKLTEEFTKMLN